MHAKRACLGYSCHHGPQKWTLPIPKELFSASLNFRTELADFILSAVARLGITKEKRWGSRKRRENWAEGAKRGEGLMYEKKASRSTHARMRRVFSALQVQCTAAALPCMPGAWIISPFRRGAIKAYREYNSRRRRRRAFGLDGWGRQRSRNAGESLALVMNLNLLFGPSLNLFFFFFK